MSEHASAVAAAVTTTRIFLNISTEADWAALDRLGVDGARALLAEVAALLWPEDAVKAAREVEIVAALVGA